MRRGMPGSPEVQREEGQVEADEGHPEVHLARGARPASGRSSSGTSSRSRRRRRRPPRRRTRSGSGPPRSRCPAGGSRSAAREHHAGDAADQEHADEAEREEHRRGEAIEPPHSVASQLNIFTPVGMAISVVAKAKKGQQRLMPAANMWWAHTVKPRTPMPTPRRRSSVAEQRLAREDRQDLGDHAHRRQDDDVDLRVAEEPEEVLPEDRVAARGRVEEAGAEMRSMNSIDQARASAPASRAGSGRRSPARPGEDRHPEEGHPRRAHLEDGGDEVDPRPGSTVPTSVRPRSQRSVPTPCE